MSKIQVDNKRRTSIKKSVLSAWVGLLLGGLLAGAFLFPSGGWLCWIAMASMMCVIIRRSVRGAFVFGWWVGLGFNVLSQYWLPHAMAQYGSLSSWVSWTLFLAMCAFAALQFAVFAWLAVRQEAWKIFGFLLVPLLWVSLEFLWPTVFPWRLGHSQFVWKSLIQISDVTGVYGVSFLVVWTAMIVAVLSLRVNHELWATIRSRFRAACVCFAIVWMGSITYGHWQESRIKQWMAESPSLRVALVQPGEFNPGEYKKITSLCREITRKISEQVDLICWPESAGGIFFLTGEPREAGPSSGYYSRSVSPLSSLEAHFLFGASGIKRRGEDILQYNSALLFAPEQGMVGTYHKRVLIPFGEYIPGGVWFPSLYRLIPSLPRPMASGHSARPLELSDSIQLGVLICYEDLISRLARETVNEGAVVLINLTNDVWYGRSVASRQHQLLAAFRAVENKRCLLRCTTTGTTGVITATGEIAQSAPLFEPATLMAQVPLLDEITIYTRYGDWFAGGSILSVVVLMLWTLLKRRRCATP